MAAQFTLVGAGPVGLLLAVLLARRGHAVRVLERRPDPRHTAAEGGRSINLALAARGIVALQRAGLAAQLAPHMVVMRGRMLHDKTGHTTLVAYGQREHEVLYAISRAQLNRLLTDAAAHCPGIQLRFGQRCVDVDPQQRTLRLHDCATGSEHAEPFQHLLGTDGAGSAVRAALAQRGLTHAVDEPLAHDYKEFFIPATVTGQHAFEPHALHIWPRGQFMLIALPNADGSFTATLFLPRTGDPGFASLATPAAAQAFFAAQFPDAAARMPDIGRQYAQHPQSHLGTLHCPQWHHDGRVLLLGDAAHAIVPFHGQGLNCGFEDCVLLDELLGAPAGGGGDIDAGMDGNMSQVFRTFEARRRSDTDAIAAMALENYLEMRDTVRSAQFMRRKALALRLEQLFPYRFIPRYSMVTFHPEISYAAARERGRQQEQVLDTLMQQPAAADAGLDAAATAQLLEQAGL